MADRADWEQATRHQRQLAVAADTELRRRHPDQRWPALRSAEPELTPETERAQARTTPRALTSNSWHNKSASWPHGTTNSPTS
jgi:hypothetical protein